MWLSGWRTQERMQIPARSRGSAASKGLSGMTSQGLRKEQMDQQAQGVDGMEEGQSDADRQLGAEEGGKRRERRGTKARLKRTNTRAIQQN